jgi:single-stranded-DNA-specific exonuclease
MSLDAAAATVAEQVQRQEFVEVFAHHDADGIAAASILCHAMLRAGVRFRLRVRQGITTADITGDSACLLCDLGSGMEDLQPGVMVVDHHVPAFEGEFHANPRLFGIDGERELSAAGTAYLVARHMGDNRDLAGLVMAGIIGDGQQVAGANLEIVNEAIANGIIVTGRGLLPPGRETVERLASSIDPYITGISGNGEQVAELVRASQGDAGLRLDTLLSLVVLEAGSEPAPALLSLYGDTYGLQREVIADAHALTAVIDACGKSGHGDLGAAICLRSSHDLAGAWEIAVAHRLRTIEAVGSARPVKDAGRVFEVDDATVASDVADILVRDQSQAGPVLVMTKSGGSCRVSARCPQDTRAELGEIVRRIARNAGGSGGGHLLRAGATIPCDQTALFIKEWQEALV